MKLEFNQEFGIKEILYNFLNDFEKYCIRKNIIEEQKYYNKKTHLKYR